MVPAAAALAATEQKDKQLPATGKPAGDDVVIVSELTRKGRGFRREFTPSEKPDLLPRGYSEHEFVADKARRKQAKEIWVKKEPAS